MQQDTTARKEEKEEKVEQKPLVKPDLPPILKTPAVGTTPPLDEKPPTIEELRELAAYLGIRAGNLLIKHPSMIEPAFMDEVFIKEFDIIFWEKIISAHPNILIPLILTQPHLIAKTSTDTYFYYYFLKFATGNKSLIQQILSSNIVNFIAPSQIFQCVFENIDCLDSALKILDFCYSLAGYSICALTREHPHILETILSNKILRHRLEGHQIRELIKIKPNILNRVLTDPALKGRFTSWDLYCLIKEYPDTIKIICSDSIYCKIFSDVHQFILARERPDSAPVMLESRDMHFSATDLMQLLSQDITRYRMIARRLELPLDSKDSKDEDAIITTLLKALCFKNNEVVKDTILWLRRLLETHPHFLSSFLKDELLFQVFTTTENGLLEREQLILTLCSTSTPLQKFWDDERWYSSLSITQLLNMICQHIGLARWIVKHRSDLGVSFSSQDSITDIDIMGSLLRQSSINTQLDQTRLNHLIKKHPDLASQILRDAKLKQQLSGQDLTDAVTKNPTSLAPLVLNDADLNSKLNKYNLLSIVKCHPDAAKLVFQSPLKAHLTDDKTSAPPNKSVINAIIESKDIAIAKVILDDIETFMQLSDDQLITIMHNNVELATLLLSYCHLKNNDFCEKTIQAIISHKNVRYLLDFLHQNPQVLLTVKKLSIEKLYDLLGIDALLELSQGDAEYTLQVYRKYQNIISQGEQKDVTDRLVKLAVATPAILPCLPVTPIIRQQIQIAKHPGSTWQDSIYLELICLPQEKLEEMIDDYTRRMKINSSKQEQKSIHTVQLLCHLLLKNIPCKYLITEAIKLQNLRPLELELLLSVALRTLPDSDEKNSSLPDKRNFIFWMLEQHTESINWSTNWGAALQTFIVTQKDCAKAQNKLIQKIANHDPQKALAIALQFVPPQVEETLQLIKQHATKIDFNSRLGKQIQLFTIKHAEQAWIIHLNNETKGQYFKSDSIFHFICKNRKKPRAELLKFLMLNGLLTQDQWQILEHKIDSFDQESRVFLQLVFETFQRLKLLTYTDQLDRVAKQLKPIDAAVLDLPLGVFNIVDDYRDGDSKVEASRIAATHFATLKQELQKVVSEISSVSADYEHEFNWMRDVLATLPNQQHSYFCILSFLQIMVPTDKNIPKTQKQNLIARINNAIKIYKKDTYFADASPRIKATTSIIMEELLYAPVKNSITRHCLNNAKFILQQLDQHYRSQLYFLNSYDTNKAIKVKGTDAMATFIESQKPFLTPRDMAILYKILRESQTVNYKQLGGCTFWRNTASYHSVIKLEKKSMGTDDNKRRSFNKSS